MTSPEDRLRQILLADAEDIVPAGDGLQQIQQRLAQRRSLRAKLVPALAIAGVVVIGGGAAVTVSLTDDRSLEQHQPADGQASPKPTACGGGLCSAPKPSPSIPTTGVTTSASGIPVWPFTTDAQAADWRANPGTRGWADDPVQVTQRLLDDYLELPGRATTRVNDSADEAVVEVTNGSQPVSQVRLVRVGRDVGGPWSVTSATSDNLSVTQPNDGDDVRSPIAMAGTASDPDTSVHVRLLADRKLGEGYAMAGRDLPWTHSLPWTGETWTVAALVANTFDGKGDLRAVTLTPVRRAGSARPDVPAAGTTFLAVDQGHVVTVDALSGEQLRQLSYPPSGSVDSGPDRGGEDGVVWVRTQGDCTSSIIRVGLARGPAGVTVDAKPLRRSLPALSAGGRSLAWVEQPCGGGPSSVVVRGPDANFSTTATSAVPIDELDVRDDGWAVVQAGPRIVLVPPGSFDISRLPALTAPRNCVLAAPAWDGSAVLAWKGCPGGQWSLGRWAVRTGAATFGPVVAGLSEPQHTGVADGQVLVWLSSGVARITDNRRTDVPNERAWEQPDW